MWNNNMETVRKLSLPIGLMEITNELSEPITRNLVREYVVYMHIYVQYCLQVKNDKHGGGANY
jgi:hypothetical protein